MPGMTIVEKIFARHSGEEHVKPGDFVVVDVDLAVMLDMSFLATERRNILKVYDPDKIAVVFDHVVPAADKRSAEAHTCGRDFAAASASSASTMSAGTRASRHVVVADNALCLARNGAGLLRLPHLRRRRVQLRRARRRRARHASTP